MNWWLWPTAQGRLPLKENGKVAIDQACCCPSGCCGRNMPGGGGVEYPTTLYYRITAVNCPCLGTPEEGELYWNATDGVWMSSGSGSGSGGGGITFGDCGYDGTLRVTCGHAIGTGTPCPRFVWGAALIENGPCVDPTGGDTSIEFDMDATLNGSCECNPVILGPTEITLAGIGCCGIYPPPIGSGGTATVSIEIWE